MVGARVGAVLEAHCSAVGKVLLAHRGRAEVGRLLRDKPLRRLTPTTTTDPDTVIAELEKVRTRGVGVDVGETVSEMSCAAAPVRDDMGVVVAAVSVTLPTSRFALRREEVERVVKAAGVEISRRMSADAVARDPIVA